MTTKLQWWLVGGLTLALVMAGVVAFAARRAKANAGGGSGTTAGNGWAGSAGSSPTDTAVPTRCLVLADGSTVQKGQLLVSAGYTPLVGTPDQKAPILASRYSGEPVGTFTGKSYLDTRYFADGTCFIQVQPVASSDVGLPPTVWIHPKHVTRQAPKTA